MLVIVVFVFLQSQKMLLYFKKIYFGLLPDQSVTCKKIILCVLLSWYTFTISAANLTEDSSHTSTLKDAAEYLKKIPQLEASSFWPNVNPQYFLDNLIMYVNKPAYAFESSNTNFCGYTAISFITLDHDPLGFVKGLIKLYKEGKLQMGEGLAVGG